MPIKQSLSRTEYFALTLLQQCYITTDDMAHLLHVLVETTVHPNSVVCEFIFRYGWWDDELQQRRELGDQRNPRDYQGESKTYWSVTFEKGDDGRGFTGRVHFNSPMLEKQQPRHFKFLRELA